VREHADDRNRGGMRYYITLPFVPPFDSDAVVFDPDILAVCNALVGPDMVLCQLASDTPVRGSDYQALHRDAPPLFPEWEGRETPPFQLAVNFSLVDVTPANGPMEYIPCSHLEPRDLVLERYARGEVTLQPAVVCAGDVIIRDVRHVHRGTPNHTGEPRPMVVAGYSRRWLRRPEVGMRIPASRAATLSDEQRRLLRFEPIVPDDEAILESETYAAFAY
jgi:ectoine hydroxylase-related dioxygenase (phytanoyl-CoA dioxygenase family)